MERKTGVVQVDLFCGESDSGGFNIQYFVTISTSMVLESKITRTDNSVSVFTPMLSTFVLELDAKVKNAVFAASFTLHTLYLHLILSLYLQCQDKSL